MDRIGGWRGGGNGCLDGGWWLCGLEGVDCLAVVSPWLDQIQKIERSSFPNFDQFSRVFHFGTKL